VALGANWGASRREREIALPCDELVPGAPVRLHRALDVQASAATTFRWLCQLKVAPYSYDLLDNRGRRSPRELTEGAERLEVGQRFMQIFRLVSFAQDEHITLRSARTAITYSVAGEDARSRLLVRVLFAPPGGRAGGLVLGNALALGDLVMMRKQLLTLRALAGRG